MVQQNAPDVLLGQTSQALVVLLQANPALHMHVCATGYIPKVAAVTFRLHHGCIVLHHGHMIVT